MRRTPTLGVLVGFEVRSSDASGNLVTILEKAIQYINNIQSQYETNSNGFNVLNLKDDC